MALDLLPATAQAPPAGANASLRAALFCRVQAWVLVLPIADVVETMRPLPVGTVAGAPAFVKGVSLIRGAAVPVVGTASLLGGEESATRRLVTLRIGERRVALEVDEVLGVQLLTPEVLNGLPPLVQEAGSGAIEAIGALDAELLLVLRGARLVPESVYARIDPGGTQH